MKCLRFDFRKQDMLRVSGEHQTFTCGGTRYLFEVPHLLDNDQYYERMCVITPAQKIGEPKPLRVLAVKKVRFLRALDLPIWETPIKYTRIGEGTGFGNGPNGVPVTCPLR